MESEGDLTRLSRAISEEGVGGGVQHVEGGAAGAGHRLDRR